MRPIITYLDYRTYLLEFYEENRAQDDFFSIRYFARKVGMDHGYLAKLVHQKVHMADGHVEKFLEFCGLKGRDADYFRTLVRFNKARTQDQTSALFEKLMSLAGVEFHPIEKDQVEFYSSWHHTAIRSLIGIRPFSGDFEDLAKQLNPYVEPRKVAESVRLLERLKLIEKAEDGTYRLTHALITTGGFQAAAIRQFQREMLHLAEESLVRHPKEHRDISTVTISLDKADLAEIKDRIAALRQSIMKMSAKGARPEAIYQLNVQLFPLSRMGKAR